MEPAGEWWCKVRIIAWVRLICRRAPSCPAYGHDALPASDTYLTYLVYGFHLLAVANFLLRVGGLHPAC